MSTYHVYLSGSGLPPSEAHFEDREENTFHMIAHGSLVKWQEIRGDMSEVKVA